MKFALNCKSTYKALIIRLAYALALGVILSYSCNFANSKFTSNLNNRKNTASKDLTKNKIFDFSGNSISNEKAMNQINSAEVIAPHKNDKTSQASTLSGSLETKKLGSQNNLLSKSNKAPSINDYNFLGKFVPIFGEKNPGENLYFDNHSSNKFQNSNNNNVSIKDVNADRNSIINTVENISVVEEAKIEIDKENLKIASDLPATMKEDTSKMIYSPKYTRSYLDKVDSLDNIIKRANQPKPSELNPTSVTWGGRNYKSVDNSSYQQQPIKTTKNPNQLSNSIGISKDLENSSSSLISNLLDNITFRKKNILDNLQNFYLLSNEEKSVTLKSILDSSDSLDKAVLSLNLESNKELDLLNKDIKSLADSLETLLPLAIYNFKNAASGLKINRTYSGRKDKDALLFDSIMLGNLRRSKSLNYKHDVVDNTVKSVNN